MYKPQKTIVLGLVLVAAFFAGSIWSNESYSKKITGFFIKDKLSESINSSFRTMPSQEQIKILREIGENEGPESVYNVLKKIYPDEPADEHELAHVIGESAYIKMGSSGFVFCDSFMRFACYHGVILEAIKHNGYNQSVLQDLGNGCLNLDKNMTTISSCVHGIGHGLMAVNSYNLMSSYEDCDKIFNDPQNLFFCYDGVSMENVVRRLVQPDAQNFLESTDPYFPCNTVPDKYQPACVREHLHHARRVFFENDTLKSQEYCLYFENQHSKFECFGALGGALNQQYFNQPETIIAECSKIVNEYMENCFGVAATQYSFGRQFETAYMVCDALSTEPQKARCRSSVDSAKFSIN